MATEDALKAVEKALVSERPPKVNLPDVAAILDKTIDLLEEAKQQVDDIRRRLSLIQRTLGDRL